jgi:hypothetical protein
MVEGRNNLLNRIPLKAISTIVTTLESVGDISIADIDLQVVTMG